MTAGFIGILALDTRFPRIPGDAGNPDSWHLPARVAVVAGAGSAQIVRDGPPEPATIARFADAARGLQAEGACLITSTCGFLVTIQAEIARAVHIPVLLSGLSLVPLVARLTGGRPVGILTASQRCLGPEALRAAGITVEPVHIAGLEDRPEFARIFLAPRDEQPDRFDPAAVETAVLAAATRLTGDHPDIGALVLECGNLPPYAAAIGRATGLPVLSILDAARMIHPPA